MWIFWPPFWPTEFLLEFQAAWFHDAVVDFQETEFFWQVWGATCDVFGFLGGGSFKHFLNFSPQTLGEMIQFDGCIFFKGVEASN